MSHGLRADGIDEADAAHVAALAALLGADHVVLPVSVVRSGGGVESDARDVRHTALETEADRRGIGAVLHGHHAEDQAETLLLRLARGTGIEGLAGMAVVAGRRSRPLLGIRRADLHRAADALLAERVASAGVAPPDPAREDPMNADLEVARVRLRREVLPALGRVGPDPVGALARLAALARDESAVLEQLVDELRTTLPVVTLGPAVLIPSDPLRALPAALGRRVLRRALRRAAGAGGTGGTGDAADAATVERLLGAPDGRRATLPGPLDASIERGWHVLVPALHASRGERSVALRPGTTLDHAGSGMRLTARGSDIVTLSAELSDGLPPGIDPARLLVDIRPVGPLHVRGRRDGDRIRTPGGTRALGEVLGEVGVPRALRDLLPVVVAADDHPLWVPGVVVDADAHVRSRVDPSR